MTECSPTTEPPRSVAKPMNLPRGPVWPSRTRTELLSRLLAAFGGGLTKQKRGTGRRIDLVAVVHFQHLDVPVGSGQCLCAPGAPAQTAD
jgi:hypothetical protein